MQYRFYNGSAFPPPSDLPSEERPQPDWAMVHRELRRQGVTLMLLWEEYCDTTSDSFSYSWYCERYKEWAGRLKPSLRQVHVAGEKLFVDYSGHTMEVIDGRTGEVLTAQVFVAVHGASNYTYAEATFTQSLPDWISSHVRAFAYFGGVARLMQARSRLIPANLESPLSPQHPLEYRSHCPSRHPLNRFGGLFCGYGRAFRAVAILGLEARAARLRDLPHPPLE
jgi:hypothetical protein